MSVTKQVSLHGNRAYVTKDDQVGARNGFVAGGVDKPAIVLPGSPDTTAIFDDFYASVGADLLGDTGVAGQYFITRKGDTGTTGLIAAGTNGVFRLTPTANAAARTVAGTTAGIVGPQLSWKPNQGPGPYSGRLRIGARVKKSVYTGGEHGLFVGFTDTVAAEFPVFDTGGSADGAVATNAFGIMWNVSGDTGFVGVAVDGDVQQSVQLTRVLPTDNVYVTLEAEFHRGQSDTGGTVTFYVNGAAKGQISDPCNISTALTPCVYLYDTGGAAVLDIDWVNVSAPRDTGA